MVDDPLAPFAPELARLQPRQDVRVLYRDLRLVVIAVERPGLHLRPGEMPRLEALLERVQVVVARRADLADGGDEVVRSHHRRHGTISIPSSATRHPAASTACRSGEPETRIGLVLLIWI